IWLGKIIVAPLILYWGGVVAQAIALLLAGGKPRRVLAAIPLLFSVAVLYGFGFWRGLFTKLKSPAEAQPLEVVLERIKPLDA
ncbi:MAG TPA: hypothetical protein VLT36_24375, partial [Candidatus Dormibacteraeota bacterium]|nr:hypothetical protein [Candidatus Dormibacteraeota bacterium]